MVRCIVFHLNGVMCGWGNAFMGSYRSSDFYPTKSAIVGILSACIGIDRSDEKAQISLYSDYDYVIVSSGLESKVVDYHTIQSSKTPSKPEVITGGYRRNELDRPDVNTILSEREYVCNGFYSVFLFPKDGSELEEIKSALESPVYTPYLGRKSCPLSIPMCPSILEGEDAYKMVVDNALDPFKKKGSPFEGVMKDAHPHIYATFRFEGVRNPSSIRVRRDELIDRGHWLFSERSEYCYEVD